MTNMISRSAETTIAQNGTVSSSIHMRGITAKGIIFPITTGTQFSFQVSMDGVTFYSLLDAAGEIITITKTAGSASAHPLSAQDFCGWNFLKVVSGSSEAAARTLTVVGYDV